MVELRNGARLHFQSKPKQPRSETWWATLCSSSSKISSRNWLRARMTKSWLTDFGGWNLESLGWVWCWLPRKTWGSFIGISRIWSEVYLVKGGHNLLTVVVIPIKLRYRVTIPLVQNLPLTWKEKFRLGLTWPGQSKAGGFEQVELSPCTYTSDRILTG